MHEEVRMFAIAPAAKFLASIALNIKMKKSLRKFSNFQKEFGYSKELKDAHSRHIRSARASYRRTVVSAGVFGSASNA